MSLLTRILEKLNLKWEELSEGEKQSYTDLEDSYRKICEAKVTVDDFVKYWQGIIDVLTDEISDTEISEQKRMLLAMQLKNARLIYKFLTAPQEGKRFFEEQIEQNFNVKLKR